MSFYKLPSPWNPGFVIPKYVQAEPPERGTITTQWLPRGTIPQLIPDYLAVKDPPVRVTSTLAQHSLKGTCFDEGTLQGSSLGGDSLGASEYSLEPLGQAGHFAKYGAKVAADLMGRMKRLPANQRATVMKKTLGAIDKTLPARAEKHALALRQRGVPAPAALQGGIARAVSEGAITELSSLGRGRKGGSVSRPGALSGALRGRGRRPMALGALPLKAGIDVAHIEQATVSCPEGQTPQTVPVWVDTPAPGHWENQTRCSGPALVPGAPPVTTTGVTPSTPASFRVVQVGPFQFPADQPWSRVTYWGKALPADWQTFIRRVTTGGSGGKVAASSWIGSGTSFFGLSPTTPIDPKYFGLSITANPSWSPVARATHPDSGKDYGVWLSITSNPAAPSVKVLNIIWGVLPKTTWGAIWDWIEHLGSKIVDVVGDALDAVKDATCSLLTQPGIDQAAVSAAAATPSPQTAGLAAGVVVGQQLCGGVKQPQGAPAGAPSGAAGWLMPVAIGGGLLLVFALTR